MFCSRCGTQMEPTEGFCRNCGAPAGSLPVAPPTAPANASLAPATVTAVPYAQYAVVPQNIYAGFWLRLVAYVIDGAIIGIPVLALMFAGVVFTGASAVLTNGSLDNENTQNFLTAFGVALLVGMVAVMIVLGWLYYAYCESSSWQGTLGKKALGIYVTDLAGNRVTFARASGRFFGKIITGMIPLFIGYIMAGFTARRQALHDLLASCLVLKRQAQPAWPSPQPANQPL